MYLFIVEGAGLISLRENDQGELAVIGTGTPKVDDVIASICTTENSYWNSRYHHWVIRREARESVLSLLEQHATYIEDKNVFPLPVRRDHTQVPAPANGG